MRVTIYLSDDEAERLEELADLEHRSLRQQATVLVLQGLEREQHRLKVPATVAAA
jgi:hypothetical protein